jgi:MOSC domain-containing protein YiiM
MVEKLFLKPTDPLLPLISTPAFDVSLTGVSNSRVQHPLKQLLILPQDSLTDFKLNPGQLKEDIVIQPTFDFHSLPSGTTLRIGTVELRLTFHCEPCSKIKAIVNPKKVLHRRGYHSQVIQAGRIQLGDTVTVLEQRHEAIPYALADRIKWYLERHPVPIYAVDLVKAIGLSASYCRAVPNVLRNRKDIDVALILYKHNQRN